MNETVLSYDRHGLPPGSKACKRELELDPPHAGIPLILQIMPASRFLAVFSLGEEPWILTLPVVAWAVVRRYQPNGATAFMTQGVEPLVLNSDFGQELEPACETSNFMAVVAAGDAEALERTREEARKTAEKPQARQVLHLQEDAG
jgi:hypothetical protein